MSLADCHRGLISRKAYHKFLSYGGWKALLTHESNRNSHTFSAWSSVIGRKEAIGYSKLGRGVMVSHLDNGGMHQHQHGKEKKNELNELQKELVPLKLLWNLVKNR